MGVDKDLKFDKYCAVDQSPRTVLPLSQHHLKVRNRIQESKPSSRNNQLSIEAGLKEIELCGYSRSVSCKSVPAMNTELAVGGEVHKRGSVYHSSKVRTSFTRPDSAEGRRKIEFSPTGGVPFSFSVLESICGSDGEEEPSLEDNAVCLVECSRKASHVKLDDGEDRSSMPMENSKLESHRVVGPSSSANVLEEDNQALQKSLSSKLALPHSPSHSDEDGTKESPRSRFTPIRKMLENGSGRNKTLRKSLLRDFSSVMEEKVQHVKKDLDQIVHPFSPAHLRGDLKVEHKHGVPYFEFSLAHSENALVAKTWKTEDALNWVYTFHSVQGKKKSNGSGWGFKFSNKDSPMVGQMQVSCHLCSELKDQGALSNTMVTEFVLYDVLHAKKGFAAEESGLGPDVGDAVGLDDMFDSAKIRNQHSKEFSSPYPWPAADLCPSNEIAAIVIQVPFEKRESLKHKSGDALSHRLHSRLLDLSLAEETQKGIGDGGSTRVNVVTPVGNHGLPTCESQGVSPLLDRWRAGGGCDCGGWDMACPLVVFDNVSSQCREDSSFLFRGNQPLDLYVQGAKERTPAMAIRPTRKGHFTVDFHAQLSALQALAVCVAAQHATDADKEGQKQLMQCSSLKALVEDEVKLLIETVTQKNVKDMDKAAEAHPPSFVLDPPFSPIARV